MGRRRATANERRRARGIATVLAETWPEAECELDFDGPLQLLFATILSAQTTDKAVNQVTPGLFAAYPDVQAFAAAKPRDVEPHIRSIGLYRNKARHLVACAKQLLADHDGQVPADMDALVKLPGVGRKTANCVLVNAFGLPGIMCDTHNIRVTNRLGLVGETNPDKVEMRLKDLLPEHCWSDFSHQVIWHGRRICDARNPRCGECPLSRRCAWHREQARDD